MNKILLSLFLVIALMGTAWANNGWYSTLQGTASDVEQTPPPNGVTIAYNTTDHEWEFNYGLAPSGGTTGTCLEKNSNSDYDYSWVTCSGSGGSATPGGSQGNIQFLDVQGTVTSFGGNSGLYYSGTGSTAGNVGIGSVNPGQKLDVQGTIRASLNIGIGTYNVCTTSGNCPSGGGSGTVTLVNTASPLIGSITTSGTLGIGTATTSTDGYLTHTDWNTFNGKQAAGTYVTSVTASGILQSSGGTTPAITAIGTTGSGTTTVLQTSPTIASPILTGSIGMGTTTISGTGLTVNGNITGNGNVGIGTETDAGLTVGGAAQFNGTVGIGTYTPCTTQGLCPGGSGGSGTVTSSGSPSSGNIAKFTTATNIAPAAASDIVNLFSTCSGTQYLGADGACHTSSGGAGSNYWLLDTGNVGINTTYNVGIGTIEATSALTVQGTITNQWLNYLQWIQQGTSGGAQ